MRLLVWSLYAAIPCHGFVPIGARGSMRRTLPRMTTEADELAEIPLFAPEAATQAPFPFPSAELLGERMYRYTFDTPSSIRMLRAVESSGTLFGHCVCSTDGDGPAAAAVGAVGVAVRLLGPVSEEFGGEVVTVEAAAVYRFVVREVVSSFPFATARVSPLCDDPATGAEQARHLCTLCSATSAPSAPSAAPPRSAPLSRAASFDLNPGCPHPDPDPDPRPHPHPHPHPDQAALAALEAEVELVLGSLARLAAPLLGRPSLAEEAAAALESPATLLQRHARCHARPLARATHGEPSTNTGPRSGPLPHPQRSPRTPTLSPSPYPSPTRHARRKADGAYEASTEQRFPSASQSFATASQSFSMAGCELLQLSPRAAAAALGGTSGASRLRLLLAYLGPVAAEMAAETAALQAPGHAWAWAYAWAWACASACAWACACSGLVQKVSSPRWVQRCRPCSQSVRRAI